MTGKELTPIQRLALEHTLCCELLKHLSMANTASKDIERQLRSTGVSSELNSALNVMCAQMELAELLAKKTFRAVSIPQKRRGPKKKKQVCDE